jgi:hypothetical protein
VNHVFVDYENVATVDPAILGSKTVHVTLLLGPRKTKFDGQVVAKLLEHAPAVQLIRLSSPGRNALDFALAYYLGRAALADPCGYFHIVSQDKGYDALIEHLRSKHIRVYRHDDFNALTFATATRPATVISSPTIPAKVPPLPKGPAPATNGADTKVWEYLRKPTTKRPRTKAKLASHLFTHLGNKVSQPEVLKLIARLTKGGKLAIGEKDVVTYHLDRP